jgi:6-phosphogluconolactonase
MTFSKIGRMVTALVASAALGLGMTACGGGTIGYMWVVGSYYNQISGFLIDDYTGNLSAIAHTPFSSGGSNPAMLVVKPGGRFVYVINSGTGATGTPGTTSYNSPGAAISVFSVGSGGILTFQLNYFSQGTQPVWSAIDSTGGYLYVLDKYNPHYCASTSNCATTNGAPCTVTPATLYVSCNPYDINGSITAFSIAGDTGRLTLVTNTAILSSGLPNTYFEVGAAPIMAKFGPGGCLYTLSANSIFPYAQNASSGQLTVPTTGPYQVVGSSQLSSINAGGSGGFIYLTDSGANEIFTLQSGGAACSLTQVAGSQQSNLPGTMNPVNSIVSQSGKFLYVLNSSVTGAGVPVTNANSSISAFTINGTGQLQTLSDTTNNPYAVGSGPLCVGQDPSNQYLFTSNYVDSTVTGKLIDQNRGYLADLSRGSVFPTTMHPMCLVISGNL